MKERRGGEVVGVSEEVMLGFIAEWSSHLTVPYSCLLSLTHTLFVCLSVCLSSVCLSVSLSLCMCV